ARGRGSAPGRLSRLLLLARRRYGSPFQTLIGAGLDLTHADGIRGQELLVVRPSLICGVMDHRTIGNRAPTKQIHASFFPLTVPIVVSLWDELGAPPGRRERLVHSRFGIGWNVSAVRASQHPVHLGRVGQQAGRSRLPQHPFERDFRQSALCLWITATDIAMDAGEPNLLEVSRS